MSEEESTECGEDKISELDFSHKIIELLQCGV